MRWCEQYELDKLYSMRYLNTIFLSVVFSSTNVGCSDAQVKEKVAGNPQESETIPAEVAVDPVVEVPNTPPSSGADITFAWDEHDFGTVWDNKTVDCTFPFMNHGSKTLVITRMKAGCGCTTPVADKTVLQPGESSIIRLQFDPKGKSKKQDKKVTIFSNSASEPEKTFWIRSIVKPIVEVDPRFVQLGEMSMGVPSSKVFTLTPALEDFVITSMKGIGKHGNFISATELETGDGQPRQIRIDVSPNMPWGAFHSQLSVSCTGTMPDGDNINHSFTVFANGRTYGKIRADDFIIRLGSLSKGGSYHDRVRIFRTDGDPFEVTRVTVLSPTVTGMNATAVQVPSIEGAAHEIIVSGTLPGLHVGPINAEILVQTDVVGEEVLRFRATGVVPKRN